MTQPCHAEQRYKFQRRRAGPSMNLITRMGDMWNWCEREQNEIPHRVCGIFPSYKKKKEQSVRKKHQICAKWEHTECWWNTHSTRTQQFKMWIFSTLFFSHSWTISESPSWSRAINIFLFFSAADITHIFILRESEKYGNRVRKRRLES